MSMCPTNVWSLNVILNSETASDHTTAVTQHTNAMKLLLVTYIKVENLLHMEVYSVMYFLDAVGVNL